MRRLFILGFWAVAAVGAAVLHIPSIAPMKDPYQRGSYAALVDAEKALAQGQPALALKHLQAAYVRAQYEGHVGVAERIRRRMALAGRGFRETAPAQAWPFLEAYALLSEDFGKDAIAVEDLYLSDSVTSVPRFEYRLTRPGGESFWSDPWATEWTGIWDQWRWWNSLAGRRVVEGLYADTRQEWPRARFVTHLAPFFRSGPNPVSGAVVVETPKTSQVVACWYSKGAGLKPGAPDGPGRWTLPDLLVPPNAAPRVAVFSDAFPPPKGYQIVLVREYQPLP